MFYLINLDVRQSTQANDSASIVKRAEERFRNTEILEQGWGKCGLFEEFVWPSNCLLTLSYFLN